VLTIFLPALRSALRDVSPGAPDAVRDVLLGAISFPRCFGSSLNPHHHYHVLALDGVFSPTSSGEFGVTRPPSLRLPPSPGSASAASASPVLACRLRAEVEAAKAVESSPEGQSPQGCGLAAKWCDPGTPYVSDFRPPPTGS
jgi:hypothetical protein